MVFINHINRQTIELVGPLWYNQISFSDFIKCEVMVLIIFGMSSLIAGLAMSKIEKNNRYIFKEML